MGRPSSSNISPKTMQGVLVAMLLAFISIGALGCLARSAGRGDVAGVKSYLAKRDSPDSLDFKRRSAPELAIILDRKEVIDLLIREGADVNRKGKGSRTPLIWASMGYGSAELIQQLIRAGADPDRTDGSGRTPLLYSVLYGSPAQTKALTDGGADPNKIMTPKWRTPVLDVAIRQRKPASVQVLVAAGADVAPATNSAAKNPKPPYRR